MKRPDRLEAPHLRHEHIDDHPIEDRFADGNEAGGAAIGDREAAAIEPRLYRRAGVQIIVNGQNRCIRIPSRVTRVGRNACVDCVIVFVAPNQRVFSFAADIARCLPGKGHRNILQLGDLSGGATMEQLKDRGMICPSADAPESR
jgi:hypothetical protein